MNKLIFRALLMSLLPALNSCSNLSALDKPVCVELSTSRGFCSKLISGEEFYVDDKNKMNGKTWFDQRNEMILVPVETWAALKKYLVMNCKKSKQCNRDIDSWNRSIKIIDEQSKE